MSKKYHGYISYKMTKNHKDYVEGLHDSYQIYEDIYTLRPGYHISDVIDSIREDLKLVAGGGYDTKNITNVNIIIKEIKEKDDEK